MTEEKEKNGLPDPYTVVGALLATMRMHRKHADRFVRLTGLHPTQHRVLMYLSRTGEACRQKELSERFELTPAAVVQILDKLEGEGYVTRESTDHDGRCKRVTLTEKGRETAKRSAASFSELDAKLLGGLPPEELDVFYRVLLRMQENLQENLQENRKE